MTCKDAWEVLRWVEEDFMCSGCEHQEYEWSSDRGSESWCSLGDCTGDEPEMCPYFEEYKGGLEDED